MKNDPVTSLVGWCLLSSPQDWVLVLDDDGFESATASRRSELDAGRPVVVDFKYIGPDYPGGEAGHTLVSDTP